MSSSFASAENETDDEEAKSARAQLMANLKEQVQRAEQASEQYRKQLEIMQQRLDEAATEQTTAEERDYQRQTEVDRLRAEIKESARQHRELEVAHEEDKQLFLRERERQANKEANLQGVINRLNETLRTRGAERINAGRSGALYPTLGFNQTNDFSVGASESQVANGNDDAETASRDPSAPDLLQTIQQKDTMIEALRFDLAEAQLKLAEQEHRGDGHVHMLEKAVMEIKMQNARLVEENESFLMLLSDKTLKGDFMHGQHHLHEDVSGMSTLAEELESSEEDGEGQSEAYKKIEADNKALREEKKALTLYIDKIIGRLLQHEGYEHIILDKGGPPEPPTKAAPSEKALPAVPDQNAAGPTAAATAANVATGFLQRARSVVSRPGAKSRPMSYAQPAAPTANENPETAPSIPLNRGHRRARSDQAQTDMAAAAVVQQMNRGSPMRTVSGGPMSPGIRPLSPPLAQGRGSYFSPPAGTPRATSGSGPRGGSSANSVTSEQSDEQRSTTDGSSTAAMAGSHGQGQGNIPGAVMKQNQLRPLRLVQEQTNADEEMQRRANRGSWIGWLRGSTIEGQNGE